MRAVVFRWGIALAGLWLLVLAACSDEIAPELTVREVGTYFPTTQGLRRTYAVTDSTFPFAGGMRRLSQLRETIGAQQNDLLNRPVRLLLRDTAAVAGTFAPTTTWRTFADNLQAEVVEGNDRVVVLQAPLLRSTTWNGNRFNNRNSNAPSTLDTIARYLSLDTSITVRGRRFDNCVLVQHRRSRPGTLLSNVWTYTFYAPNVGKVLHVDRSYQFQDSPFMILPGSYLHVEEITEVN